MKTLKKLGKRNLMIVAVAAIFLALALTIAGMVMVILGAKAESQSGQILLCLFGAIIAMLGLVLLVYSSIAMFVATVMPKECCQKTVEEPKAEVQQPAEEKAEEPAKKPAAKKSAPAKKTTAKKPATTKAPAKKPAAKKTTTKKTTK